MWKYLLAALLAVTLLPGSPARASTATGSVAVSATVLALCTVTAGALAFGNYSAAQLDATANLAVTCTSGTSYTVGLDAGSGSGATVAARAMSFAGSSLNYTIYSDSGRTSVWGNAAGTNTVAGTGNGLAQTLTAYGRVAGSQAPAPGAYTDTVTATLTY